MSWQPSLFASGGPSFDREFKRITRRQLPLDAWVDHQPGWVDGADALFDLLLEATPLRQRDIYMYERRVAEPRLTHRWVLDDEQPPIGTLTEMAAALGAQLERAWFAQ